MLKLSDSAVKIGLYQNGQYRSQTANVDEKCNFQWQIQYKTAIFHSKKQFRLELGQFLSLSKTSPLKQKNESTLFVSEKVANVNFRYVLT